MLVATTRKPSEDPGKLYSGDRGTAISLNSVDVSIPRRSRTARSERCNGRPACRPIRKRSLRSRRSPRCNRKARLLTGTGRTETAEHQVIIFVHGFNNTYADAVFRFAQIVHDSGTDAAPILFTWPSRGRVFDYLYDKESANYSRRALEDLILQAVKSPDVSDVTILAHSMGGWLAAEALRGVAMREKSNPDEGQERCSRIAGHRYRRVPSPVHRDGAEAAALCDPDIDTRQGSGDVRAGYRVASAASADPISDPTRLFSTNSAFRLSTPAPSRRTIRSATMPSPTVLRSCACSGGGWQGRASRAERQALPIRSG